MGAGRSQEKGGQDCVIASFAALRPPRDLHGMWVHDVPPETARLLRLADVCGATGMFTFAVLGLGLCLGGVGASGLLLLRYLYRNRNKLASWCCRRRGTLTTVAVPTHEIPIVEQTDAPFPASPGVEGAVLPKPPRLRLRKVGVLELFYPTPPTPRSLTSPRQPRSPRGSSS